MDYCCMCGEYLSDTSRMICYNCDKPVEQKLSAEQAIELLKHPERYMFIHNGEIELEGWLREAIKMAIDALRGGNQRTLKGYCPICRHHLALYLEVED